MPSRLSSLLVRDGLVGVKRMEKAFQRQVIYGGTLDTILLEMNLVPEERLTQYLALASGLPPAARHEGTRLQPEATAQITRELAEKHRAVPLGLEGDAIRVLVCSPLELSGLEDLADLLDRPLQPLIAPEYRWHLVFAAAYGLDAPARYATLARQLDVDAPTTPIGRGSSIIIDADGEALPYVPRTRTEPGVAQPYVPPAPPKPEPKTQVTASPVAKTEAAVPVVVDPPHDSGVVLAPVGADEKTLKIASLGRPAAEIVPDPEVAAGSGRVHRDTIIGVEPNRAVTDPKPPERPTPMPIALTMLEPVITRPRAPGNAKKKQPLRATEPAVDLGGDTPIAIVRARELLASAPDRDAAFKALLRATRSRARYAGLLSVQGGNAVGRIALGEAGIDVAGIASVSIPLEPASPFRQVVENQQPHVGKILAGDPAIDLQTRRFGGTTPTSALLLPVVLRGRVVAIIVAHRLTHDIKLADVTELLPLASATADALSRLIVKAKAAGYRAPTEPPVAAPAVTTQIPAKTAPATDGAWATPAGPATPVALPAVPDRDLAYTARPDRPMAEILDEIENAAEGHSEDAIADAVERSSETLGALMKRFPGKLRVDRFSVTGRSLRAAQYGGLLELVVRLGSVVAELLVDKMAAPQRDVRFYATVCAAELRPRSAVYALVERVFDQDYGVRAMAIEALSGYPIGDLGNAMARARRAVRSVDPEVVLAATSAIVELGDIEAIGDLIRVVEASGRAGEAARKGLVSLTAQDFGSSERKWRKWWTAAKGKHRIEWLIDGLMHKDDGVREAAIAELRRLTGEYFGYHHDLPRRERDLAGERWAAWWRESGQRRFVARDDERGRPTAVLPARRQTD